MVLLEFSMTPMDKGESVSRYVAGSLEIVEKSGLPYRLNSMGTVIEGSFDEVMKVVKACHERMARDCRRVSTSIRMDYRQGSADRMEAKVKSVEEKLGHALAR